MKIISTHRFLDLQFDELAGVLSLHLYKSPVRVRSLELDVQVISNRRLMFVERVTECASGSETYQCHV